MTNVARVMTPNQRAKSILDQTARLVEIIRVRSFRRGKIRLSSGAESDFYFDMKPAMFDPKGADLIAELMLAKLRELGADYVGGLEMGAVPIIGGICLKSGLDGKPIRGFFVRKEPKKHGTKRTVEGLTETESLQGKKVVLVDDVTTTGGSVLKAVDAARQDGAIVLAVITIVDRLEGARDNLAREGIPLLALCSAHDFGV
jgi:orotate phosphoribosyltransferase